MTLQDAVKIENVIVVEIGMGHKHNLFDAHI